MNVMITDIKQLSKIMGFELYILMPISCQIITTSYLHQWMQALCQADDTNDHVLHFQSFRQLVPECLCLQTCKKNQSLASTSISA
jgi:hypothetical protein